MPLHTAPPPPAPVGDLPDPAQCPKCAGKGTVETCIPMAGIREVLCDGPDGTYNCDAGSIW